MSVTLHEPALRRLLETPGGAVGRDITRRITNVAARAVENASGREVRMRTGALADSVQAEVRTDGIGLHGRVWSDLDYGYYLEAGTPPHTIRARNAFYLAGGRYAEPFHPDPLIREDLRVVDHPGFESKPWLTDALEEFDP